MKKTLICIAAVLVFAVSACGEKKDAQPGQSPAASEAAESIMVGSVEIKPEYLEYIERVFQSSGAGADSAAQQAREQAIILAKYIAVGEAMNLDISSDYDEYVSLVEQQQGGIEEFKKSNNLSDDTFDFICRADVYQQKLLEQFEAGNTITDEQKDEYFKNHFWRAKHLLLLTQDKTDEEKKEIKKKIDELYEQVKAGADFDELISQYNEDPGVEQNPDGYVFTDGEMVPEFQEGVSSIAESEFNLVETSYGYHIVQRLPLDETPERYEQFKTAAEDKINQAVIGDAFNKYIESKLEEYKIEVVG